MPKHLPPLEHRFKKGQSGNPGGRVAAPEATRKAIKKKFVDFVELMNKYWSLSASECAKAAKDTELTSFEMMVAKLAVAAQNGSLQNIEFIFDVMYGKKRPDLTVTNTFNFEALTPEQMILLGRRVAAYMEEKARQTLTIEASSTNESR